jgi:hypothetical protein
VLLHKLIKSLHVSVVLLLSVKCSLYIFDSLFSDMYFSTYLPVYLSFHYLKSGLEEKILISIEFSSPVFPLMFHVFLELFVRHY